MTDETRRAPDTREIPLNPPDAPIEEKGYELAGERVPRDQAAFVSEGEIDTLGDGLTHVDMYEGELEAGVHDDLPGEPVAENLEMLTELELRAGETDNPDVAAEEGLTYIPPIDPPVVPSDDPQDLRIAAGFGTTALDEPYDQDHGSNFLASEDEMSARVREALRADAATTRYADEVAIGTRGSTVALRGWVDDVEDTDNMVEVASRVTGVAEVIDELEVRSLQ